ncbi:MAG: hypothetical protein IKK92_09680 [Prevotella sp.]|nr:hypothetical protein [Prevotella sp.]
MLKCNICGSDFIPRIGEHYVAKDCGKTGIATIISDSESKIYDAFDCPVCGCQIIAQERKRVYVQPNAVAVVDEDDEEDGEDNGHE